MGDGERAWTLQMEKRHREIHDIWTVSENVVPLRRANVRDAGSCHPEDQVDAEVVVEVEVQEARLG